MINANTSMEPQFLELDGRRLFCLRVRPHFGSISRVLVLPPCAEEMNKSRRLLAMLARELAERDCDVLVPDLYGTGDSSGRFEDATWNEWRNDVQALAQWHAGAAPRLPAVIVSIRTGILLMSHAVLQEAGAVVALQPVLDGDRFLQQFLRIRVLAEKFAGRDESIARLLESIAAGESVEVGGYAELGACYGVARRRCVYCGLAIGAKSRHA